MKKKLAFFRDCAILFLVMRDTENYIYFWNVTYKVRPNPNYKGNHQLATFSHIAGNTYSLETTKQEMIEQFLAKIVNKDINGKTWTYGEMIEVEEITKCFEDRSPKGRFHKDNY